MCIQGACKAQKEKKEKKVENSKADSPAKYLGNLQGWVLP